MEALHSGTCDITISIDCDGQDDINAMDEMVKKYLAGAEVVYGVRSRRDTDTFFKRFTAEGFYHVMNALGADIVFNHADYRLISTRVLESFADYREVNIFLRGMVPLVGFRSDVVTYERHERLAGESHYPLSKMLALAFDGITSLSNKPIRIITGAGIAVSLVGTIRDASAEVRETKTGSVAGITAKKTGRMILDSLEAGGKGSITVAVACAMAGMIAGCITVTGLASKLISGVIAISSAIPNPTLSLLLALFLTMLCCIVLGMGVPTTANYCIMASTCAPILITLGIPKVAAHFFVFYFGIVADITPPVALAAYAGSAIAKSDPMKTGINATKLAIAAFIVPYIFAYSPAMLFVDVTSVFKVIQIVLSALLGIFGVAAALNGYILRKASWLERILLFAGGLTLMIPGTISDLIGLVLIGGIVLLQYFQRKKAAA